MGLTSVHHEVVLGVEVLVAPPALVVRRRVNRLPVAHGVVTRLEHLRAKVASDFALVDILFFFEAVQDVNVELLLTVERFAALCALPVGGKVVLLLVVVQRSPVGKNFSANVAREIGVHFEVLFLDV